MDFKEKLYLLKLLSLIEIFEENRYTRKVFIEGKYKIMIIFNGYIVNYYCNLCIGITDGYQCKNIQNKIR